MHPQFDAGAIVPCGHTTFNERSVRPTREMNMSLHSTMPAVLMLEDGTTFEGHACGCAGEAFGEIVFNTSMSGYQEILSDPSMQARLWR